MAPSQAARPLSVRQSKLLNLLLNPSRLNTFIY